MRKVIVFLCVTVSLMLLCAGALAADDGVALLTLEDSDGGRITENAVCVTVNEKNCWIAPAAWISSDTALSIRNMQFSSPVTGAALLGDSQLALLTVPDSNHFSSAYPVAPVADLSGLTVHCCQNNGTMQVRVNRVSPTVWHGLDAFTLSGPEGLLPGSALIDGQGRLAGILVGVWGEGRGNYLALRSQSILQAINSEQRSEIETRVPAPAEDNAIAPGILPDLQLTPIQDYLDEHRTDPDFSLSLEDGLVYVNYHERILERIQNGEKLYVCFLYDSNNYYTWHPIENNAAFLFPAVPEHDVYVWLSDSNTDSDADEHILSGADGIAHLRIPAAARSTQYGYQQECYPAVGEADLSDEIELDRTDWSLADYQAGKRLYLQVIGSYEVDELKQEYLTFVLYAPDGQVYLYSIAYFNYEPEIAAHDAWHIDLTEMFENTFGVDAAPHSGTYTIAYYISGELAGSTSFEIAP